MTISNGNFEAGLHYVELKALNLTSGVYFYRLEADGFISQNKLILMR